MLMRLMLRLKEAELCRNALTCDRLSFMDMDTLAKG